MRAGRLEASILGVAALAALALGASRLAGPSLWHDELVHVAVAQSIVDNGRAALPSGEPYYNGTVFHLILAAVVGLFGDGEAAVRGPSVALSAVNVVLSYWVLRPLIGRPAALVAAVGMALSPWNVAWARQARFYTLHQTLYLVHVGAFWHAVSTHTRNRQIVLGAVAIVAFLLGVLTSYHGLIFLATPGAYAVGQAIASRRWNSRWIWIAMGIGVVGAAGIGVIAALMNTVDRKTVIENGGLGGAILSAREYRWYYLDWLRRNLGSGFFLLAIGGGAGMIWRERARGAYATLAFWAPVAVLTFLIGYRWPRFMFFAYPFYIAAWAYGVAVIGGWLLQPKPGIARKAAAIAIVALLARVAWSAVRQTEDALDAARGAQTTLATQHPQWRAPCAWVKAHADGAAILTTSFLPVKHYAGRVDEWYPSRALPWETVEAGLPGLPGVTELQAYVAEHPRGYFVAEWWRFERNFELAPTGEFAPDVEWVKANMRKVEVASSADVTVYAWGDVPDGG